MDTSVHDKILQAEKILEAEKEELMHIITSYTIDEIGSPRSFLMFLEEDAKYRISALGLPKNLLQHYLNRICDIYGPYSEDQPNLSRKYYDNDIYLSS